MGLDMYLNAERFLWTSFGGKGDDELKKFIATALGFSGDRIKDVQYVKFEAAYWRKDNHIHRWFVENVQGGDDNCEEYDVSREQLTRLIDVCKSITSDHGKAPYLLPPQPGFFFGSYDYDDSYLDGVSETIEMVERALKDFPKEHYRFTYRASW